MSSDRQIWNTVERILESKKQLACVFTGGGSTLLNWLFNHVGASRFLVEAQVPYASRALEKFLCKPGPHPVATNTARDMAFAAFARATELGDKDLPAIGFALTAALTTTRPRKGIDRACVALAFNNSCRISSINLNAKKVDRSEQETIVTYFALSHLATVCGIEFDPQLPDWVEVTYKEIDLSDPLKAFFQGKIDVLEMGIDGKFSTKIRDCPRVFLSGSFNPLHEGHVRLAKTVEKLSGREANLEISIQNVDKPDIALSELEKRLDNLRGYFPVILTRCPRFFDKARLFVDPHFVVGYDTAERLVDGRYYEDGLMGMQSSLKQLYDDKTVIWVAGRLVNDHYRTLSDISFPKGLDGLFRCITQEQFRLDVSSTQLRSKNKSAK